MFPQNGRCYTGLVASCKFWHVGIIAFVSCFPLITSPTLGQPSFWPPKKDIIYINVYDHILIHGIHSERVVFSTSINKSINALFGLERMFWGLKVTICLPHTSYFLKSSRCHEKSTWSFLYVILNNWFVSNKSNTDENTELADTQLCSHTFCAGFLQK